ncbi:MAG: DUF4080 domain-containing protein [Rhodothermaceae bacterium]
MNKIVLTTLNARYIHSAIGLRYLLANLKEFQEITEIQEYVITESLTEITEKILTVSPDVIGIGVYIWNASEVSKLIGLLKKVSPETIIILGGPEASHQPFRTDLSKADYIISGEGDSEFYSLCKKIAEKKFPEEKIIKALPADVTTLELPYKFYNDEDIANRVMYVEASRGCPFTCEFCLSSIDKSVRSFDVDKLFNEFDRLWEKGARKFKFIDRTFNLNIETTNKILNYFLAKEPPYLVHFEMIPEHFPEKLKEKIKLFPPASIQFEVGIQTLNEETAKNIKRNLNLQKIKENLHFLETETNAHLHVDLIIGLPGESVKSFAENLNTLTTITKSEIQLGVLKKLSGTEISRHDEQYGMLYSDIPPYDILQTDLISFAEMQKMKRFARFWDLTYNSGNFNQTVRLLWKETEVFTGFKNFSEWLYSETLSTYQISLNRLAEHLFKYLTEILGNETTFIADTIVHDILKIQGRKLPKFLRENASEIPEISRKNLDNINKRQLKHL